MSNYPSILLSLFFGFLGLLIGFSIVDPSKCFYIFTYSPQSPEETLHGFSLSVILIFIVTYAVVTWFGYLLSKSFWNDLTTSPRWLKFIASFFIGYVCSLGLLRVASLFIAYKSIYFPFLSFLVALCVILKYFVKYPATNIPIAQKYKTTRVFILFGALLMVFLLAVLVHQVDQGDFHFNGHGYKYYAYLIDDWKANPPGHFPIITKHYDELLFHYFLTLQFPSSFPNLLAWWLTLGLIKTSIFVCIFLLFQKIGMSMRMSLLSSAFIFLGTTSLIPTKYYLLFDSSNLLFFVVHSGRLVGIPLILFFIGDAILFERKHRLPWYFFVLSGLGLASTSISNSLWLMLIYFFIIIYTLDCPKKEWMDGLNKKVIDSSGAILCYVTVVTAMLMYGLDFKHPSAYWIREIGLLMIAILVLLRFIPKLGGVIRFFGLKSKEEDIHIKGGLLITSILLGLFLLGNMFTGNSLGKIFLKSLTTVTGPIETKTLPVIKGNTIVPEGGDWSIGDHREGGTHNEYCKGVVQFVHYYGLILVIILITQYFFSRSFQIVNKLSRKEFLLYEIFLINVASIPFLLFFMDFINVSSRAWLKSRFLEVPIYIIIFVFLYFTHRLCTSKQKIFLSIVLFIYIVVPFVATGRPAQMMHNFKVFIQPAYAK